jgi:hypothetical protein
MGFKKNWDVADIIQQLHRMGHNSSSPYTDGFTGFEIKKELYEIKDAVDTILKNLPRFSGEDEWLEEQEKKRVVKILKDN